jgi:hypothetical protein
MDFSAAGEKGCNRRRLDRCGGNKQVQRGCGGDVRAAVGSLSLPISELPCRNPTVTSPDI